LGILKPVVIFKKENMCLIVKKGAKPRIANRDITVYKELVVFEGIRSPYYFFEYELGKKYTTRITFTYKESGGYDMKEMIDMGVDGFSFEGRHRICAFIKRGFHAAVRADRIRCAQPFRRLFRCTIPKGSEYYANRSGLIVSNQIIINEIVESEHN